jgi:hypothetical protein
MYLDPDVHYIAQCTPHVLAVQMTPTSLYIFSVFHRSTLPQSFFVSLFLLAEHCGLYIFSIIGLNFFPICNINISLGFEVLTAVVTKISIFLDIMPCSSLEINRFGGTRGLNLQDRRISQSKDQHETGNKQKDLIL